MKKGIVWLSPPSISGENLLSSWARLMENTGWKITEAITVDSSLIFASSDSQLEKAIELNTGSNLPLILYFWGYLPERFQIDQFKKFADAKFNLIKNHVNKVFVPNQSVLEQLQYAGIKSSILLPGIDSVKIQSQQCVITDFNKVVMIGRLVKHKSHLQILKAFIESGLDRQFHLQIIGTGETGPILKDFIKNTGIKATITEDMDDDSKIHTLKSSLCSIYASEFEGFGAPIAESLFAGTPAIVLDSPWARSMYKDYVIYYKTERDLAKTVLNLFSGGNKPYELNPPYEFSAEALTARLSYHFLEIINLQTKKDLGTKALLAHSEKEFKEIYQEEAIRNWETSAYRFNPYWLRHWRVDMVLKALEGEKVIDIGCSYGSFAIRFAKAGFKVTALDIAPFYLDKTKEFAIQYGIEEKNLTTVEGNAGNIPFDDNHFDSAWLGEILEHTDEPEKFLKEAIRVIKKDGVIIISTPIGTNHDDPLHLTHWDDELIENFINKFKDVITLEHFDKISERQGEPSCYLIKLRKL